jgi:tetratricopeptide (TPR) repeat protein
VLRTVGVIAAVVLAGFLGAVQLASSAAYGDLAVRPSFPAALHDRAPHVLRPLLGGVRAQAAAAIHDGDLATARRLVAALPDDAQAADLRGRIAEAAGERDAAVTQYVRARDEVRAQALIDAIATHDPLRAVTEQALLVRVLADDPNASEVLGEAWWRLGQLQAAAGYAYPARRRADWRDAEASYERALELAPNEETYLLAAGYQSLANGDASGAERFYRRAAEVVPNSADAFAGIAWVTAAAHDCARARPALARARELRARSAAANPVRDPVDDPIAGPALKRCTT